MTLRFFRETESSMDITSVPVIRVLLVDDHPSTRRGIRTMLEQAPDIEVVGEASDGAEAQDLVAQLRPDVVLLDVEMPGLRGYEVEAWIRKNYPKRLGWCSRRTTVTFTWRR